jgi:Zierdtviridae DNA helicase
MSVKIERVGNRIWLRSPGKVAHLGETVPGANFSERDGGHWSMPLTMDTCTLLRERFGDDLEIGVKLWAWAKAIRDEERATAAIRAGTGRALDGAWAKAYPKLWKAVTEGRPYQGVGANWIKVGRQVLIGDTVGLGKTPQALAGVIESGVPGPYLVVCPKTAVEIVWAPEIRTWLPGAEVITVPDGRAKREKILEAILENAKARGRHGGPLDDVWVVVHPEMLRTKSWWICRECGSETLLTHKKKELVCEHDPRRTDTRHEHVFPVLFDFPWGAVIADESDRSILRTTGDPTLVRRGMELIRESIRPEGLQIAQSGTPFRSRPHLLWSTLNWLRPEEFTSFWGWVERYFEMSEGYNGSRIIGRLRPDREAMLYRNLDRIMLRRTRAEVAPHLPKRLYVGTKLSASGRARVGKWAKGVDEPHGVWLPMDGAQEKAYAQMLKSATAVIKGGTLSAVGILAELTRLKQFATSAGELDERGEFHPALPSNKFDYLVQMLRELGYPDDPQAKVVVVSQFTQTLDLFKRSIEKEYGQHVATSVTGSVTGRQREEAVSAFNLPAGKGPSLLFLNTKAGGSAITLDSADEMVFIDETWIPDDQEQAEGRIDNRRPEEKIVQRRYRYLRTIGSVDEGIAVVNAARGAESFHVLDGRRGVNLFREVLEATSSNLGAEYLASKLDPTAFTGPMRRCDSCGVRRNQYHEKDCETQK